MTTFKIMRAPGPRARRSMFASPPWRRMSTIEASSQQEALRKFMGATYIQSGHAQFRDHSFLWVSDRSLKEVWNHDDGLKTPGRRWRLVVTLANGQAVHDVSFEAWKQ